MFYRPSAHAAGSTREQVVDDAKTMASDVKDKAEKQLSNGKQAVKSLAEKASNASAPLKPKVADTMHGAAENGERPATVSTGTQTDPAEHAKKSQGTEAWDQAGAAETEWEGGDQNSKPGLLGAQMPSYTAWLCSCMIPALYR